VFNIYTVQQKINLLKYHKWSI